MQLSDNSSFFYNICLSSEFLKMIRKVLMVCLGNICRSPIAEAVLQDIINKAGLSKAWQVDSAGITNEHQGKSPDSRSLKIMKKYNLAYSNHSRPIKHEDFNEFDYILGMDEENILDLKRLAPAGCKAKIFMLGDFGLSKDNRIIEDPYYERGDAGFEKAYQQCVVACDAFLKEVQAGNI